MINNSLKLRFITILFCLTTSCNQNQEEIAKNIEQKIKSTVDDLAKNPSQPIDEVKKLSKQEYKTLAFPLEEDTEVIDKVLNQLGEDRWQCYSAFARPRTAPIKPEMLILCRRTPETVLRFIPNSILGR
jgi:hypothetical protein